MLEAHEADGCVMFFTIDQKFFRLIDGSEKIVFGGDDILETQRWRLRAIKSTGSNRSRIRIRAMDGNLRQGAELAMKTVNRIGEGAK
jgi:hypothetical protein